MEAEEEEVLDGGGEVSMACVDDADVEEEDVEDGCAPPGSGAVRTSLR